MKEKTHIDLAHQNWVKILKPQDWAIDATCGNGHDTLFLSQHCSGVIGIDIQEKALQNTRELLKNTSKVHLFCQSHATFPLLALRMPIALIVYNLGYLPGGNKELTTQVETTLISLQTGLNLLLPGGLMSITCYPGHAEGQREEEAILHFCQNLSPEHWSVCFHSWKNRQKAPSLVLIQKNCS